MTSQEALAQAYREHWTDCGCGKGDHLTAYLPEGWVLVGVNTYRDSAFQVGIRFGAQQERERLREKVRQAALEWRTDKRAELDYKEPSMSAGVREDILDEGEEWCLSVSAILALLADPDEADLPDTSGPIQPQRHEHAYTWHSSTTGNECPPPGTPCIGCGHRFDPDEADR